MSRPVWKVSVSVTLVNGQAGRVDLQADQLLTLKEVERVFTRAIRMCQQLSEPIQLEEPTMEWPKPRVVA
jgi:hypothetical protein